MIHPGRWTAELDGDVVVFLIGARIHKPWKVRQWVPVARAMNAMQREIAEHPEIGCLHVENFGALRPISVQYWRSFEDLERFARSSRWSHLPAWRSFNRLIRDSGDLGIWHETYRVRAGEREAMYGNMPVVGLAAAGRHVPIGRSSTAARRIAERTEDRPPVEAY
jgi:Domain of unknown function (DUF4188)